jgi:hypothetical protein
VSFAAIDSLQEQLFAAREEEERLKSRLSQTEEQLREAMQDLWAATA